MARLPTVLILLTLAVAAVSDVRHRRRWIPGGIHEETSSCISANNSSVRCFFVGDLEPQVGYPDSDDWQATFNNKETEFKGLGLDHVVCDEQCFSNLPNLVSFLTFVYFPPCKDVSGQAVVVTPCRSLCEAAREEYGRFRGQEMELACPLVDSDAITNHIPSGQVLDLEIFDCSQYLAAGACVPKLPTSMTCDFIPSTHVARHVHQMHLRTGYPGENDVSRATHLHSFAQANHEFRLSGLEAMVNDSACRRRLPNTVFFLTVAFFPVCNAHRGRDRTLTYPCRSGCEATRNELKQIFREMRRSNSPLRVEQHSPDACHVGINNQTNITEILALPIFDCSRYRRGLCVSPRPGDTTTREPEEPTGTTCRCRFNESECLRKDSKCNAAIRNKVNGNSFVNKTFGTLIIIGSR